jgi:acetyl esterase/lipase
MLSWQARTLNSLLSAKRYLHPQDVQDIESARANLEMAGEVVRPIIHIDHIGVLANGVPSEWVIPAGMGSERVILYLHGGAYNAGSTRSHRALAANIAYAARARALTIDYRLAPEHPYPAALVDAFSAYKWLLELGIRSDQITVTGDSAGGGLTIALLVALRERRVPMPAAAVVLSPWTDLSASGESWQENAKADYMINGPKLKEAARLYLKDASPQTPLASPVYANLHGLPPLLIQVGSEEVLLSDSQRLAENARLSGVDVTLEVWEGMQHVWHFAASFVPEARQAIEKIGEFIRAHSGEKRMETASRTAA